MENFYLDPENTRFESAHDGTLNVISPDGKQHVHVQALRAFPLSHNEEQIVLRDGDNKEIGILSDLKSLSKDARELVQAQLHRRYFLPLILRINSVYERFGTTQWELETDRGVRKVTTKPINDALFEMSRNRYLLTDNENNRYEIADLSALDEHSRSLFLGKG